MQYINRTYDRSGTLWEGWYRSGLTEEESYVMACYRYIELNPVRAQMVDHPGDYRWSSYGVNGQGEVSRLITPHPIYDRLGRNPAARQKAYRELFRQSLDPDMVDEIRRGTNGNFAVGGERFAAQIERTLGRRASPGKPGRPRKE